MGGWIGAGERSFGDDCENSGREVPAGEKGVYPTDTQAAAGGCDFPAPVLHRTHCRGPAGKG